LLAKIARYLEYFRAVYKDRYLTLTALGAVPEWAELAKSGWLLVSLLQLVLE
jgi:hypothetical protein